jgi:hypothetical protein
LTFRIQKQILQLSSLLKGTQLNSEFLFDRQSNIYSNINSLKVSQKYIQFQCKSLKNLSSKIQFDFMFIQTVLSNQYQELQYLQSSLKLSSTAVQSKCRNSIESHSIQTNLDIISSNLCYNNDIETEEESNYSCSEPSFLTSLSIPPATPFAPQSKSSSSSLSSHDNECWIGFPSDIFYVDCYNSN